MTTPGLDWGVAFLPLPGERQCGDLHLVAPFPGGILLAVVDGLGHGEEAARASATARDILLAHAGEPVTSLVRRCHGGLRGTRGVVMSVAAIDWGRGSVAWLGVGNVQGVLVRSSGTGNSIEEVELLLRAGVVGSQLPTLLPAAVAVGRGDTLIFATDGIETAFQRFLALAGPPQRAAETILARHNRRTDDALVLVARYLGASG